MKASIADRIQAALRQENLDGWLFYSFRGSDPIAENIPQLDHARLATRRWFYFVPTVGEPTKLVHAIESEMLNALPGEKKVYLTWQQLHSHLGDILAGSRRVAMQYSPPNAIPYISRVDAGTVELVQSFGVDVVSSADLVQIFEAVWTSEQMESHLYAAAHMRKIVDVTFGEVARRTREKGPTTELDIQAFIWNQQSYPGKTLTGWQVDDAARQSITRRVTVNGSFIAPDIPFTKKIMAMVPTLTTSKLRTIAA